MIFTGRAQAAVEYLFIVALALMLIVPGSIVFYRFSADSQAVVEVSKITSAGNEILGVAEELYSLGAAWETVDVNFPNSATGMWVYNATVSELALTFDMGGPSEVVFFTHVSMGNSSTNDCTNGCFIPITPGDNRIRIESNEEGQVVLRLKD
ncbi:hypothetical protein JXA48_04515 [Candidatus Woesearchaeota archaeon]|nr:hypothetical protein [Candidatus Woesearchaeota archaeon]